MVERCWAGVNLLPKHVIAGDIGGEEGGTAQIPDAVGVVVYGESGRGDSPLRALAVAARCWAGVNLLPKHVIAGDIKGEVLPKSQARLASSRLWREWQGGLVVEDFGSGGALLGGG